MTGIIAGRMGAQQAAPNFFYRPNLDLVNQALAGRQKRYDTNLAGLDALEAKMDEVNSLEGYDTDRWFEIKDKYGKKFDALSKAYGGDLSKATGLLKSIKGEVGDLFGLHGEANAINSNHAAAMKNRKELRKRREKDEITEGQYRKWDMEMKKYMETGIGKDPKN